MLKRKLKQWLGENEPGVLIKREADVPGCSSGTPALAFVVGGQPVPEHEDQDPRPEARAPGSPDSAKENGDGNKGAYASAYASTSNLAAAAAFATGLPCGKRMREMEKFKPSSPARRRACSRRRRWTARTGARAPSLGRSLPRPSPHA